MADHPASTADSHRPTSLHRAAGLFHSRTGRVCLIAIGLLVLWLIALATDIVTYSTVRDDGPADAAIVLGAAVYGTDPSPVFEERIKHAIDLYQQGRVKAIIFTGGKGDGEHVAESIAGSVYAIKHGVSGGAVFCETASHFTHENLLGAKAVVERQHFDRVLIVSDPLHMRRALTMARDFGLNAYSSPTPTSRYISLGSQLNFLWGEVRYYATYLVRRPWLDKSANYAAVQPCIDQ
jgi:uncharacterized SAM-binding protein YcdF (DUF218 family)